MPKRLVLQQLLDSFKSLLSLIFFTGPSPQWTYKLSKRTDQGGDEERGQMQLPRDRRLPTPEVFFTNHWIKRSTVQYVNTAERLLGQLYVLVDSDYIYFFIFCF